jgi:pyruvate dehydrogenase complex dehydrogenase (E1) component
MYEDKEDIFYYITVMNENYAMPEMPGDIKEGIVKGMYKFKVYHHTYSFPNLRVLMAKASPYRSGDVLAELSAATYQERVAAQLCLADIPLQNIFERSVGAL